MMKKILFLILTLIGSLESFSQNLYFPPLVGNTWETSSPTSLNWDINSLNSLDSFLAVTQTKGAIILKDGKIVFEKYYGTFTKDSNWYWASAGKSLTSVLVGIAQQNGFLSINDTSQKYLGVGFTSMTNAQEQKIKILHQLSMTSGLDDGGADKDCYNPSCLKYKAEPGTRWAYHNAPYTILDEVIDAATGLTINEFALANIKSKTGMDGIYFKTLGSFNNVYYSKARSMARFGLLMLNKGYWDKTPVLSDSNYFKSMITSSQNINPSYGYLWWLNGKSKFMAPGLQISFNGPLFPNAPMDMYSALGKNGQFIFVVPSMNLVAIRIGNAPLDYGDVAISYGDDMWKYLKKVFPLTSMNELNNIDINVYPNPFLNEIQIEGNLDEKLNWELMNSVGEIIQKGTGIEIKNLNLNFGIYYLRMTKNNQTLVKKLMKVE
jgi:CubicO group peptidase (beta-lactamase class C family)